MHGPVENAQPLSRVRNVLYMCGHVCESSNSRAVPRTCLPACSSAVARFWRGAGGRGSPPGRRRLLPRRRWLRRLRVVGAQGQQCGMTKIAAHRPGWLCVDRAVFACRCTLHAALRLVLTAAAAGVHCPFQSKGSSLSPELAPPPPSRSSCADSKPPSDSPSESESDPLPEPASESSSDPLSSLPAPPPPPLPPRLWEGCPPSSSSLPSSRASNATSLWRRRAGRGGGS